MVDDCRTVVVENEPNAADVETFALIVANFATYPVPEAVLYCTQRLPENAAPRVFEATGQLSTTLVSPPVITFTEGETALHTLGAAFDEEQFIPVKTIDDPLNCPKVTCNCPFELSTGLAHRYPDPARHFPAPAALPPRTPSWKSAIMTMATISIAHP